MRIKAVASAVGALVLALTIDAASSGAKAAPWCAWYDAYTYNCGFYTFQQCLATASGAGGSCARNVYDLWREQQPYATAEPYHRKHHRHHRRYD